MLNLDEVFVKVFWEDRSTGMHVGIAEAIVKVRHLPTGLEAVGWGHRSLHKCRDMALLELERKLDLQNVTRDE